MSEADDLFNQAYKLHVVEEHTQEAIGLCRRVLELDPQHYRARVFLGILLGDRDNLENKIESRQQFVEALQRAANISVICNSGFEESAIHHLGVWEWGQNQYYRAVLFFLLDFISCKSNASYRFLFKILEELDPNLSKEINLLLSRIKKSQ